jgi:hypothetical protein
MSYDPALLAFGVATILGVAMLLSPGAPWAWVLRFSLPVLWIASREFHSTWQDFSRRNFSKRELFLSFWLTTFFVVLTASSAMREFM